MNLLCTYQLLDGSISIESNLSRDGGDLELTLTAAGITRYVSASQGNPVPALLKVLRQGGTYTTYRAGLRVTTTPASAQLTAWSDDQPGGPVALVLPRDAWQGLCDTIATELSKTTGGGA
ncbi:hypothetical protein [Streptomyces xiamenensis]|uniref:hypothetical protein n=1 Tax=Streptomyces xiamenensis TaxID=408015 RepID=UPI003D70628C